MNQKLEKLNELEPRILWEIFGQILKLPRPSGKEEKIRQWLWQWARSRGFEVEQDSVGNMVIEVPATEGKQESKTVILQAHMDMVCEKNEDVEFDFEKDAIEVYVDGDWLRTKGTSMGADNGIGLASALAVSIDKDCVHGPMQLLFTVDEESGLTGAFNLSSSLIGGDILINLDSEEEGTFFVGCAGGGEDLIKLPLEFEDGVDGRRVGVRITGLRGGHSGLNINDNRANAIKLAAWILRMARSSGVEYKLETIGGGDKHNAIPRECNFTIIAEAEQINGFKQLVAKWREEDFEIRFGKIDPEMRVDFSESDVSGARVLNQTSRDKLLSVLLAIPHGVLAMSRDIEGLVETSNNLAKVEIKGEQALITTSSRSSVAPSLEEVRAGLYEIATIAGGEIESKPSYPGWKPNMDSALLAMAKQVYREIFGKMPDVTAVHAGLECGILGEKKKGLDMLSFGPTLSGVHSPDEKVQISSVRKFYHFLKELLRALT